MNPAHPDIQIKNLIVEMGTKLYAKGFAPGMSGNISCRCENKIFITGTGFCLGDLSESKIAVLDYEGIQILNAAELPDKSTLHESGTKLRALALQNDGFVEAKPSSEGAMHIEIYKKRQDIGAIIHAHCPYSTALGISKDYKYLPILAEAEVLLGKVPVVDYATPSTHELAQKVAENFNENNAVIMSNHGVTVCGKNLQDTFYRLEILESYAQVYLFSGLLGNRSLLTPDNLKDLAKLKH